MTFILIFLIFLKISYALFSKIDVRLTYSQQGIGHMNVLLYNQQKHLQVFSDTIEVFSFRPMQWNFFWILLLNKFNYWREFFHMVCSREKKTFTSKKYFLTFIQRERMWNIKSKCEFEYDVVNGEHLDTY